MPFATSQCVPTGAYPRTHNVSEFAYTSVYACVRTAALMGRVEGDR